MTTSNPPDNYYFLQHIPSLIIEEDNQELEVIPSEQENFNAFMSMDSWKSSGPNGFPLGFYQSQWKTVKDDVCKMIKSFFILAFFLSSLIEPEFL